MKYKNYKSAIHNFTHSFISIDYMKSGRLAVNVLIDLHNLKSTYLSLLEGLNGLEVLKMVTGKDLTFCPICKEGRMHNKSLVQWKEGPS